MKLSAFGDCHIGSYGKRLDEGTGLNARLLDTVRSTAFAVQDALDRGAGGILFAGDMFRTARPSPTELVKAIEATYIPFDMQMITGNHDLPRAASEESALSLFRSMGHDVYDKPAAINQAGYQLFTLPYPNRAQLAATLPGYADYSPEEADELVSAHLQTILQGFRAQIDPSRPSILLAHISLDLAIPGAERGVMAGRDITIPLSAIPEEFTFVVLGHIHYAQDFSVNGRPNVFYCGSTERIDFSEEWHEKSYVLMDLDARTWERVPIPCREYCTVHYEFGDIGGTAFRTAADDSNPNINGSICRVKISRPEHVKPDYAEIQRMVEQAGAWDYRGVTEDVERTAAVRSEEITKAQTLGELLGVWADAKGLDCDVAELAATAEALERNVA